MTNYKIEYLEKRINIFSRLKEVFCIASNRYNETPEKINRCVDLLSKELQGLKYRWLYTAKQSNVLLTTPTEEYVIERFTLKQVKDELELYKLIEKVFTENWLEIFTLKFKESESVGIEVLEHCKQHKAYLTRMIGYYSDESDEVSK